MSVSGAESVVISLAGLKNFINHHIKEKGVCVLCGSKRINQTDFKDDISRREYRISGMCQDCQDEVFTEP